MASRLSDVSDGRLHFEGSSRIVREQIIDIPIGHMIIDDNVDIVRVVIHPPQGRSRQIVLRVEDITAKAVEDWR
jgi:hypothetical protein